MSGLDTTLQERGEQYGVFMDNAHIAQRIKSVMRDSLNWDKLESDQKEALDFFASKIGRLLSGNVNHFDSWHDIGGYAKLIADRLEEQQ